MFSGKTRLQNKQKYNFVVTLPTVKKGPYTMLRPYKIAKYNLDARLKKFAIQYNENSLNKAICIARIRVDIVF